MEEDPRRSTGVRTTRVQASVTALPVRNLTVTPGPDESAPTACDDASMRTRLSADSRRLIAAQALRAAGYGFTAVLIGALLAARAYSTVQAGILLGALVAGTAGASLVVGAYADRVGRRRTYVVIYLGLAAAGAVVAAGAPFWLLLLVALTGLLSTDVVDNGPATTLEQAMLAAEDTGAASSAAGSARPAARPGRSWCSSRWVSSARHSRPG